MAIPKNRRGMKPVTAQKEKPKEYFCKDCAHITEYRCKNIKGEYFMCRCPFQEWSKFLNSNKCKHFKLKEDEE